MSGYFHDRFGAKEAEVKYHWGRNWWHLLHIRKYRDALYIAINDHIV